MRAGGWMPGCDCRPAPLVPAHSVGVVVIQITGGYGIHESRVTVPRRRVRISLPLRPGSRVRTPSGGHARRPQAPIYDHGRSLPYGLRRAASPPCDRSSPRSRKWLSVGTDVCSCSNTIRASHSWTSGENFFGLSVPPSSQDQGSPATLGRRREGKNARAQRRASNGLGPTCTFSTPSLKRLEVQKRHCSEE